MLTNITLENVYQNFEILIGDSVISEDGIYTFSMRNIDTEKKVIVNRAEIETAIQMLSESREFESAGIVNQNYLEVHVREESRILGYSRYRDVDFDLEDIDNGLKYEMHNPSLAYIIYVVDKALSIGPIEEIFRNNYPRNMLRRRLEEEDCENLSIEEYFSFILFRYPSIIIRANKNTTVDTFKNLLMSYIFQLSYNTNYVIIPQRNLEDIFRNRRIGRFRRNRPSELDPPRRVYPSEIINHYQMALSSESPYLEYLSYYHVIEHFFDSVFNDDLLENIKRSITSPSFSYKRKKDILSLVKQITKAVQLRNEDLVFSEIEALRLTLTKYTNIDQIKSDVDSYDPNFLVFYRDNKVQFSDGDLVDLNDSETVKIYKQLSNRIYKTRNALVHSKDNDKSKYTPFHDDKVLVNELPLLRSIAEQIIINTSRIYE